MNGNKDEVEAQDHLYEPKTEEEYVQIWKEFLKVKDTNKRNEILNVVNNKKFEYS